MTTSLLLIRSVAANIEACSALKASMLLATPSLNVILNIFMKANVILINKARGMIAARECGENNWVIIEVLDSDTPEIGDQISNPEPNSMGRATYRNYTQERDFEVYVQNIVGTEAAARTQCFL